MSLDERLQETTRKMKEYDRLKARLDSTRKMEIGAGKQLDEVRKQLNLEKKDVERLDGKTLVNLWHSLMGTKEEARRKEQEEYLTARLKFDEASVNLENLKMVRMDIENRLAELGDPQEEYSQALQEKERFISSDGGPAAQRLIGISERAGNLEAREVELREAIDAGNRVDKALAAVEKSLSNASSWGVVDILGGGLLTTALKHSNINDARQGIQKAQDLIQRFKKELSDVQLDINADIGTFLGLADYFLDGLVVDIFVQSKISAALERCRQLRENLRKLEEELNVMLIKDRELLQQCQTDKNRLLESLSTKQDELFL